MKPLFISATNTNIGKTYASCLLSAYCNKMGVKTLVCKPIETGDDGSLKLDCQIHLEEGQKVFPKLRLEDINFYRYLLPASPFVAQLYEKDSPKIDFKYIGKKIDYLRSICDFLIIEGAGGLCVPIDFEHCMLDLASYLDAHLLLISGDKLGMINDLILNKKLIESKKFSCSYAINLTQPDTYEKISKPYIEYLNTTSKTPIYNLQKDIAKIISEIFLICS